VRAISSTLNRARLGLVISLLAAVMLVQGCATAPQAPTTSLAAAKVAISNAERADATSYAGAELGSARQKLVLADRAVAAEDMITAQRLADESRVEAELAFARTETAKADAINQELQRGADALAEEMQRSGDQR
jgi:hypothetical protein